uniref:Uncharacterized protein n=1 Tax=Myotis myotis TaxID=51298 RepID=A0A7J7QV48_MYOMY|nr:hypothetical protein mMyoMyo1_011546 [Myotis myotis]
MSGLISILYFYYRLEARCTKFVQEQASLPPAAGTGFPPAPGTWASLTVPASSGRLSGRISGRVAGLISILCFRDHRLISWGSSPEPECLEQCRPRPFSDVHARDTIDAWSVLGEICAFFSVCVCVSTRCRILSAPMGARGKAASFRQLAASPGGDGVCPQRL